MKNVTKIFLNALPILAMIGLIPVITSDYFLTLIYIVIIAAAFFVKKEKGDALVFTFGFFAMIAAEYLFVSTGIEIFMRTSLFGLMPLWLPFLWAYGFVAIKRSVMIIGSK